jgi:hypothetical protein
VKRSPGGCLASNLVHPLNGIEPVLARFTAVGLDVHRKQDVIRDVWPRTSESGGLAAGALRDITSTSQGQRDRRQPPNYDRKSQAHPDITSLHDFSLKRGDRKSTDTVSLDDLEVRSSVRRERWGAVGERHQVVSRLTLRPRPMVCRFYNAAANQWPSCLTHPAGGVSYVMNVS